MINPNSIDKLLDGVEVEWKPLGEVGKFTRGKRFVRTDMLSEGFPCIHYGEMYTHYNIWANTPKSYLSHDLAAKLRVANHGDVIIVAAGETIEDIGNGTAWLGNTGVVIHDACFSYRSSLNPKYVSYFLRTKHFHDQIKKHISTGKISAINEAGLRIAKIPIPPPEVQEEIVRILDTYTELTAELTAELTTRKRQYTYYRDKLLTFDEGEVEWRSLGEIADIGVGSKPEVIYENVQSYEYINAGTTNSGYCNIFNCDGDTVTTPSRGQGGIGFVGYQKDRFWLGPLCYKIKAKKHMNIISKYLYYFLQGNNYLILKLKKEGGVPAINRGDLIKLNIPVPPLEEQDRIVSMLDKFEALTSSITEGLPREIELRKKQYEYYRNMLLSFPKSEVEA
ncbi:restriction endonuclease subunit S [Paenibacillus odorifer]|uniref:Restriction endonuclease subunit S n=1 Tax=Paenibacillus odorifer TaxID=189426 RepID=A0A1R0WZF4_9BACL|nr:restriction endonuclease subunit S [Paenibacillus odorifer]OMD24979.1 restriction endonuclease subunit S [Paenibacillus odorifer]